MKLTTILAFTAIGTPTALGVVDPRATPASVTTSAVTARPATLAGPSIELWTNEEDVYRRGQQIRVYFRTSLDAYVTVFRIDTDGRVRVVFPQEPWEDNYARRGQRYETRTYGDRYAFIVDDYPGQGYLFAVASADPFSYHALVRGDHWDYREISSTGRITGDPYVALTDLVDRIVPPNYAEYSYDILPYYVEQRHEYPRFLCYDCHAYASYPYWNPYAYSCFRFRVVIYDDYYYYPVRYGGRARFVYARTTRIAPRYVFKDRAGAADPFVTRVRQQPVDVEGRRVLVDQGVRGRDLGGVGQVPSPIRRRTLPDAGGGTPTGGVGAPTRRTLGEQTQVQPETGGRRTTPAEPERRVGPETESSRRPEVRPLDRSRTTESTARPYPQLEPRRPAPERETGREPEPRVEPRREPVSRPVERSREPAVREVERPREVTRPEARPREAERRPPESRQPESRPQPQSRSREPERQAEPRPAPQSREPPAEDSRRRPAEP